MLLFFLDSRGEDEDEAVSEDEQAKLLWANRDNEIGAKLSEVPGRDVLLGEIGDNVATREGFDELL